MNDSFYMLNDYQKTCEIRDGQTLEEVVMDLKRKFFEDGVTVPHSTFMELREKYSDEFMPDDELVSDKGLAENQKPPPADLIGPLQMFRHKTRPNRGALLDWMEAATFVSQRDC